MQLEFSDCVIILERFSVTTHAAVNGLGAIIDSTFSFWAHVDHFNRIDFFHLRNIDKLRNILQYEENIHINEPIIGLEFGCLSWILEIWIWSKKYSPQCLHKHSLWLKSQVYRPYEAQPIHHLRTTRTYTHIYMKCSFLCKVSQEHRGWHMKHTKKSWSFHAVVIVWCNNTTISHFVAEWQSVCRQLRCRKSVSMLFPPPLLYKSQNTRTPNQNSQTNSI